MSLNRVKRSSFSWVNPRILLSWKQEATIKTKRVDVEVWEERGVTKGMMTTQHINKFYWYKWKVTTVHSVEHINSFVFRISWRISKTEAMLNLPNNLIFLWSLLLRKKCSRMKLLNHHHIIQQDLIFKVSVICRIRSLEIENILIVLLSLTE